MFILQIVHLVIREKLIEDQAEDIILILVGINL